MKKFIPLLALPLALSIGFLPAETKAEITTLESTKSFETSPQELAKVSKAFGHMIGQNVESLGLDFDMKEVLQGIQDCVNGIQAPMTEAECIQAISLIQENAFQKLSADNLKIAEEFLSKNKASTGVIEVDPGKLQYMVLQAGTGKEVEPTFSPVIRYTGKFIDGKVFGESGEDEVISLDETIEGFKKGIVGMKEGEKRRIFVHPDCGYGINGFLPPSSLLTFDIEIIKANAPKTDDSTVSSNASTLDHASEIASIDLPQTKTR